MLGYIHKDTETGCLIPVTTAGPTGGTVEKLEYGCDKNYALPLTETTSGEGYVGVSCECPIYYNPVSGTLTVDNITGNITNAEIAECVCVTTTSNNTTYSILLICDCHIYKEVNQRLNYNPATNELQAFNLRGQCVDYYCGDFEEATIDTLTSTTVTARCFCGTALCAISADGISDGTVTVRAQCNNELNIYPSIGSGSWINYRGGASSICFGDGNGTGALGDVYAANFCGNVACAKQVRNDPAAGDTATLVYSQMADNDQFRIMTGGGSNDGWAEIATADDGNEPIYVRQYTGVFTNVARTATLLNGSGNTEFPGTVYVNNGVCANKGGVAADNNVAGFCFGSSTTGSGYYGGAYVGHCNPAFDGYWGFATFGFYNAENDTLCRGICVDRNGYLYGVTAYNSRYNGSFYIPTADSIRYYLSNQGAVTGSVSGCTLYLSSSSWS